MNVKIYKNVLLDFFVILLDILMTAGAYMLGFHIIHRVVPDYGVDYGVAIIYIALELFLMWVYEIYTSVIRNNYELRLSLILSNSISVLGCAVIFFIRNIIYYGQVKPWYFANIIFMGIILSILMYIEKRLYVKLIKYFEGNVKLLVLDDSERKNDFARKIKYSALSVYDAWYVMVNDRNEEEVDHIIKTMYPKYNNIFISPRIHEEARHKFISSAVTMGKDLYIMPELYNLIIMKSSLMKFDDTPALKIKKFGLTKFDFFCKRALDIVVSLVGVIVSSPIMLLCAIAIKLDSKGPVFYKQERLTKDKKPFYIYKFRSMIDNAERLTGPVLATYDDPRITRVGKIMRRTRLDELPQLINVLNGSMSLVGPRPERRMFIEKNEREIPDYDKRFLVKAGLTGTAHVYARYDTAAKDKALFEMLYIRDYSFMLDIKIILFTLKVIFMKDSAEGIKDNEFKRYDRQMETPEQRGLYGDTISESEKKQRDEHIKKHTI